MFLIHITFTDNSIKTKTPQHNQQNQHKSKARNKEKTSHTHTHYHQKAFSNYHIHAVILHFLPHYSTYPHTKYTQTKTSTY